jgi:hypothetical protein
MEPSLLSFTLVFRGSSPTERQAFVRELASVLMVKEPVRVAFSSDNGLYYEAVTEGALDFASFIEGGALTVNMHALSAALYGVERSVTVPSGGSATLMVGGSYPTNPTITASAALVNSSTGLWGVRLDAGDFLRVAATKNANHAVSFDCETRVTQVDGATKIPTLDSDWLALTPGIHTIANDAGTGACVVSWRERWV